MQHLACRQRPSWRSLLCCDNISKAREQKMRYRTCMLLPPPFPRTDVINSTIQAKNRSQRHKGRSIMKRIFEIRDFILHLATGPCWDLSCYEIMSILRCSLSQPSISSLCFHHQEYSAPVTSGSPPPTPTPLRDGLPISLREPTPATPVWHSAC